MATLQAVIHSKRKRADKTFLVTIRVTHKTQSRYIGTSLSATREDLTRTLKIRVDSPLYIEAQQEVKIYQQALDELGPRISKMEVGELKTLLVEKVKAKPQQNPASVNESKADVSTPPLMPVLGGQGQIVTPITPGMIANPAGISTGDNQSLSYALVNGIPCLMSVKAPWEDFHLDFIEFGWKVIKKLKAEGEKDNNGNYLAYENMLRSFSNFLEEEKIRAAKFTDEGNISIEINHITSELVNHYKEWLDEKNPGGRSVSKSLSQLSALFNRAKAKYNDTEINNIMIPRSPFAKVEIPYVPVSEKKPLTPQELIAIASLPDKKAKYRGFNRFNMARDLIVLSFLMAGMNSADLFTCDKNIINVNGKFRLIYHRKKTRNRRKSDHALINAVITPEAHTLIAKYADPTHERVFCFHHYYSNHRNFNLAINKGLKEVGKAVGIDDLEFYAARRGWANIARYKCGISNDDISLSLGHRLPDKKLAIGYTGVEWEPMDKAIRAVTDHVFHNSYIVPSDSLIGKIAYNGPEAPKTPTPAERRRVVRNRFRENQLKRTPRHHALNR